jgi:Icc-related predicted phosphoesterase
MKIVATADLHGYLPEIPECDLLLIAGDVCPDYFTSLSEARGRSNFRQANWLNYEFRFWLQRVPAERIVGIPGNHDFVFEQKGLTPRLPWTYLEDHGCEVDGLRIWGVPWVPNVSKWAFYGRDEVLRRAYDAIPDGTDIILSHGPPRGYGDTVAEKFGGPLDVGAEQANDAINRVRPEAFVCGHIHEGFGQYLHTSGPMIYNVAHVTENYDPLNVPVEIQL